jgi:hypothetical protein
MNASHKSKKPDIGGYMKKSELMKLLKTLTSREMRNNPEEFIQKLKAERLDKIDIRSQSGAKKGLDKIIKTLSLETWFSEIEIEDNNQEDDVLKENMDIWINRLKHMMRLVCI